MATTLSGAISRLVRDRGFGFIRRDGGGDDLFFHRSALINASFDDLNEGQRAEFEMVQTGKGPRAEQVRLR